MIGDLIVTEILQGSRSDQDFEAAKRALLGTTVGPMAERMLHSTPPRRSGRCEGRASPSERRSTS